MSNSYDGDPLDLAWKSGPWADGDGETVSASTDGDQGTTTTTGEPRFDILADADAEADADSPSDPCPSGDTNPKSGPELAAISRIDIALDSTPDLSSGGVSDADTITGQTSIAAWTDSPLLALKHDLRSDAETIRSMSDSPETQRFAEHVLETLADYPDRLLKTDPEGDR